MIPNNFLTFLFLCWIFLAETIVIEVRGCTVNLRHGVLVAFLAPKPDRDQPAKYPHGNLSPHHADHSGAQPVLVLSEARGSGFGVTIYWAATGGSLPVRVVDSNCNSPADEASPGRRVAELLSAIERQTRLLSHVGPGCRHARGTARTVSVQSGTVRQNTIQLNSNGTLLNGDYIQISSGGAARLHMVVGGGWSGNGTYTIEPALKASYSAGTPVTVVRACGLWRLDSNDIGWDADRSSLYSFSFSCTEAF